MTVTVTGPYTVSGYDGYTFYKFTGGGSVSWDKPTDLETCDITVVGGGGGGSGSAGGGGGYCNNQTGIAPSGSITVMIGAGGSPSSSGGQSAFGSYTANGGTSPQSGDGGDGGSGGGPFSDNPAYYPNGGSNGAAGTTCGSYAGGTGQGTTTYGCDGILRCGGGGGGQHYNGTNRGLGGSGGGGDGANLSGTGYSGSNDYGGGGGGGSTGSSGGSGGSGIVIVKYIPKVSKKKGQPQINSGGLLIV